jgi:hypothetical protein
MYRADMCAPPRRALVHLEKLVDGNGALIRLPVGPKNSYLYVYIPGQVG